MTNEEQAQFAAMVEKVAALEAKLATLDAKVNPKPAAMVAQLGPETPYPRSTYDAIDRMTIPKEMSAELVRNVGTEMVQRLVRDGKR